MGPSGVEGRRQGVLEEGEPVMVIGWAGNVDGGAADKAAVCL